MNSRLDFPPSMLEGETPSSLLRLGVNLCVYLKAPAALYVALRLTIGTRCFFPLLEGGAVIPSLASLLRFPFQGAFVASSKPIDKKRSQ